MRLFGTTCARAYAGLPSVKLVVIEDSYHFIMFDPPEAFEAGLRAGLND